MYSRRVITASIATAISLVAGCGESIPSAPLTASAFVARSGAPATAPATVPATAPASASQRATVPATQPSVIMPPLPPADPAKIPVMLAPGQYQTIGGVVSEVNGNPIYANRVMRILRGELAARAPEMDPDQFRKFAADEIRKTIESLERAELLFAAADRTLVAEDRQLAEFLTMQFRTRKITDAGGSVEIAQRKAQTDGENFEELIYDQYRKFMTDIFYRRKVFPRIQVTANDLRSYYNVNVGREFTELDEATFRLIKIDPKRSGGRDSAQRRVKELAEKATAGNFAELARTMNNDDRLARSGGEEGPIQRGAYKLEKVEAAVWAAPVGSITPVIEDTGAFYVALVETRKTGSVKPFEDRTVQEQIRRTLESRQFRKMSDDLDATLRKNSMVRKNPDTQAALDLAMQGYAIWTKG